MYVFVGVCVGGLGRVERECVVFVAKSVSPLFEDISPAEKWPILLNRSVRN